MAQQTSASGASAFTSALAACAAGRKLIGGAFAITGSVGDSINGPRVLRSHKLNGETWFVEAVAPDGYSPARTYFVTAYAYCVNP